MLHYEEEAKEKGFTFIIGVDEAGRGPLAGPVVAAAVSLKEKQFQSYINDSKKLTPRQRETAYLEIVQKTYFGIGFVNEGVIDQINIRQATRIAMQKAVEHLVNSVKACPLDKVMVIIDGNMSLDLSYDCNSVVKADAKSLSVASASIIAKVTRDRLMDIYEATYPGYGFSKHKGYGTREHFAFLREKGLSPIHRRSFLKKFLVKP